MALKNNISLHEAMVLALIKVPTRTDSIEKIAAFISNRNLYPDRNKNITIEEEILKFCTQSNKTFNDYFIEIGAGFIRLKESHAYFAITLINALEELLQIDSPFYYPIAKQLSVVSIGTGIKETLKIKLRPDKIICIVSKEKGRKKHIYISETGTDDSKNIICYRLNNNPLKFEKLCSYLDPVNGNLVQVSKSTIVNVAYFNFVSKQKLGFIHKELKSEIPSIINVSGKNGKSQFLKNFIAVKEAYYRRFLLQKTAFDYKSDIEFLKDPQICFIK